MSALKAKLRLVGPALLFFGAAWLIVRAFTRLDTLAWAGQRPSAAAQLSVQVRDDGGGPLAEVQVRAAGHVLGATDAEGGLRAGLAGNLRNATIEVQCPEAYRAAAAQTLAPSAAQPSLTFVCRPRLRTIALVVHAPSARGLLVRADQQSLGRIDDQGVLHAVLRKAPGSTLWLAVETRAASAHAPNEASSLAARRALVVEDRDRVVLFDPVLPVP
jgi:hypothetical protein